MRRTVVVLVVAALAALSAVSAAPAAQPLIGAIRWDAWFDGNDTYGDAPWWCCWGHWTTSTLQSDWSYREPLLGWDLSGSGVDTQAIVDQEIDWAADRGLDYWAFDWYPENLSVPQAQIMDAFNAYMSSPAKGRLKFAFIVQPAWVAGGQPSDTAAPEYYWRSTYVPYFVAKAKDPQYLRIAGNRPVIFWFGASSLPAQPDGFGSSYATELQYLRDQIDGTLDDNGNALGDPYFVEVTHDTGSYGMDAVSSYGPAGAVPGSGKQCYSAQASKDMANAASQPNGLKNVPGITPVNDNRPRSTDSSYGHDYGFWTEEPTYGQWESHLSDMVEWVGGHPSLVSDPGLILAYAWNELDEGGAGMVPTHQEQFKYLDAVDAVSTGNLPATYTDTYNADNCAVSYSGSGWLRWFPTGDFYDNDVQLSSHAGDTATLTTANTSRFVVRASGGPNRGKVKVRLDGSLVATVDLYSSSWSDITAYDSGTLTAGTHTLQLEVDSANNPSSSGHDVAIDSITTTVQRTLSPPSPRPFVTKAITNRQVRNDFSGAVGMKLTVGGSPISVSKLGRYCLPGNSATHTLRVTRSDGTAMGSVNVAMSGCDVNAFKYASLSSPVNLAANTTYYVTSDESASGDRWYGNTTLPDVTTSSAATVVSGVYQSGGSWYAYGGSGDAYGPVSFLYG